MRPEQPSPDDDALVDQLFSYDAALANGDTIEIAAATPQNRAWPVCVAWKSIAGPGSRASSRTTR